MSPILVPIREAAELCGVSKNTVINWSREGLLPLVQVGGRGKLLVRYADLEALAREAVPA